MFLRSTAVNRAIRLYVSGHIGSVNFCPVLLEGIAALPEPLIKYFITELCQCQETTRAEAAELQEILFLMD